MSNSGSKSKVGTPLPPVINPKEATCFYCFEKGHWKQNWPKYIQDLKDGKVRVSGSTSGNRKLTHRELNLIMGNSRVAPVEMIGTYELKLSEGEMCCPTPKGWGVGNVRPQIRRYMRILSISKMTMFFSGSFERGKDLLDIIHMDVYGPFKSATRNTYHYYVTFIDDFSSRASLPISFWGYALETATHILNSIPTKKVLKTLHEIWCEKPPSLAHIKKRYLFRERLISKKDSWSAIDLEKIQEVTNEELVVNTSTQPENFPPKDGSSADKAREYSGRSRKRSGSWNQPARAAKESARAVKQGSRREGRARAAKLNFSRSEASKRLGFDH
ncbi:hypothetical protein OSB04_019952 [Centaurea solstitialis]|uniref:Uncharacterized protein n=1 Tax=Centaurea solstitialis TaxID=347529 RepID=A0AA38SRA9_9ASTR|nr:hypothetical protein OSB04_019952 [Centaurea solstitialis]